MALPEAKLLEAIGDPVVDVRGGRLGSLHAVMVDRVTGELRWLVVRSGTLRPMRVLVPPVGVTIGNGTVWVPYDREVVGSSPTLLPGRPVSPGLEHSTCRHYGIEPTPGARHHAWERRTGLAMVRSPVELERRPATGTPQEDRRAPTDRAAAPR